MNETLSSKTAKRGNTFTTTVREPVYSNNGVVVIPVGSEVIGRVDAVRKAERGGDPARSTLALPKSNCRMERGGRSMAR